MRPVVVSRAIDGSPASPNELLGNAPPSVHVAPLSVERDHPVKCEPVANEPESLNPTTTVLPKATTVFSLWVNWEVPVDPLLLLINALTEGSNARTMAGNSVPPKLTGQGNASGTMRTGANLSGGGALTAYGLSCFC